MLFAGACGALAQSITEVRSARVPNARDSFTIPPSPSAKQGSWAQSESEALQALRIGAGDLVDITVFDTPELSQKVRVDNSGQIDLPLGGSLRLADLTIPAAQKAIETRLRERDILRDPHVAVFVADYATQGVTVAGQVRNPGIYPLLGSHDVVDLISAAGGLTQTGSNEITVVHRNSAEGVARFNLRNATRLDARPVLLPGDRIIVSRSGVVYVLGDVGRPGGYSLEDKEHVSVLEAIALAQGINKTARLTASVIRNTPAGRTQSQLALKKILSNQAPDPELKDGDILYVPVSGAKDWASKGVNSILQMAVGVVIYGRL